MRFYAKQDVKAYQNCSAKKGNYLLHKHDQNHLYTSISLIKIWEDKITEAKEKASMFGCSVKCQQINTIIVPLKQSTTRPLLTSINVSMMQGALDQNNIITSRSLGLLICLQGFLMRSLKQFLMASTPIPESFAVLVNK